MNILVIGDSCTDIFRYGEVTRLAPEAPIPIIKPERETQNPGMAGNVVANLKALGVDIDLITNKKEIRKIRYVCSKYHHLLLRVDENDNCKRINIENVLCTVEWEKYDAVIISDYCKGFLNHLDIEYIDKTKIILNGLQKNKSLSFIYDSNQIIYNEREFRSSESEILRLDRLIIKDNNAIIIDYKTSKGHNDISQVSNYLSNINLCGFNKVTAFLLYVSNQELLEVTS